MNTEIQPLPAHLAKKAKDELNEDPDKIPEYIKALREWILTQPHLNSAMDSKFLLTFLRRAKFSLQLAKTRLDLFYTIRTAMPETFTKRDINDPRIEELLRLGFIIPLPKTFGEDGPRIVLIRLGVYKPRLHHFNELSKVLSIVTDMNTHADINTLISGIIIIFDFANIEPSVILQIPPLFVKKISKYYQDAVGSRIKGFHIINVSKVIESFVNFCISLLNKKNQSRVFISSIEDVYEHIPKHLLPKEYGGETSTIPEILDNYVEKIREYNEILIEEEQYGVDETKRLGTTPDTENLFGMDGTFRKLDID